MSVIFCYGPAHAETTDYEGLVRSRVIKCLHPTANADKATIELGSERAIGEDEKSIRVQVFYPGLLRHNSMEFDLMIRQAGSIRQLKVKTLSDTGIEIGRCAISKNWTDF